MTKNNLNVGFLITDKHVGIGGLENVLIDVVNGLNNKNINAFVFILQPPQILSFIDKFENIQVMKSLENKSLQQILPKIIHHNLWKLKFTKEAKYFLTKNLNKKKLDALIVLNLSKNLQRVLPSITSYKNNNPHVPIIAWPHISFQSLNFNAINTIKNVIYNFDHIFAISNGLKIEIENLYNLNNIDLIYNPIKKTDTLPSRNKKKFIFVGRVNDSRKRVKELLKTMSMLKGDWHLDILGGTGSTEGDQIFTDYIHSLNIQSHVTFHGWCDNPWDKIKEAGTVLLNSTHEGFPLVLLEAMMHGIPCVSSDCPTGPNEIIQDNHNGWLYDVDDENKLLNILQEIIDGSRTLPSQENIINSVQKFSEEIVLENFKQKIIDAIKRKKI